MYEQVFVLLLSLSLVLSKRHVIRSTQKLRQQGYHAGIDLGEVIAEAVVDSREACVGLCETNSACKSVMLIGQLCRMFAPSTCQCFAELTHIAGSSRYLIGTDPSVTSFQSAMKKCNRLGAHSVHINSREEHELIKQYIKNSGEICVTIWTGGRSSVDGSNVIADWFWYYSSDFRGASEPFTFLAYGENQPNGRYIHQNYMVLSDWINYDFNDFPPQSADPEYKPQYFLCECP